MRFLIFYGGLFSAYVLKQDGHTILAILQGLVLLAYAINGYDSDK